MQFEAKSHSQPEFYGTLEHLGGAVEQIKKLTGYWWVNRQSQFGHMSRIQNNYTIPRIYACKNNVEKKI